MIIMSEVLSEQVVSKKFSPDERYRITTKVTIFGAIVNFILSILKIVIGYIGHSHALVVDGIHSFSDLLSDVMVVIAAKHGSQSPDENHPYGHARIETAFAAVLGGILITVGVGIVIDALDRISYGDVATPSSITLWVALFSVLSKEGLYQYTLVYAKKLDSTILKANAWHHRSDAISSIVVLIGIGGSIYGIANLDAAASVIVSVMISKIGWDIAKESIDQLVDKGLDPDKVESIKNRINDIPGVLHMHMLRTRQMGSESLLDVHIQVAPQLSVSEGHRISDEVSHKLINEFSDISQVLVHIDAEDDENSASSSHLPLRDKILKDLKSFCGQVENMTIHYLDGQVSIQIILSFAESSNNDELKKCLSSAVEKFDYIKSIDIIYQ